MAFYAVALAVIAVDQVSKYLVQANMTVGQSLPPDGVVRLHYVTNTGGLFGLFPGQTSFVTVGAVLALVAIVLYYRFLASKSSLARLSLGLVLGGAVGNLIDRLRLGYVIDFVDLRVWPVFNLADAAVTVGVIAMVLILIVEWRKPARSV